MRCFLLTTKKPSVANATVDLLMLAAWGCVLEVVGGDPIPVSFIISGVSY
jgi:hypothetical protein